MYDVLQQVANIFEIITHRCEYICLIITTVMKQKKLIYLYVLQDATNLFEIIIH